MRFPKLLLGDLRVLTLVNFCINHILLTLNNVNPVYSLQNVIRTPKTSPDDLIWYLCRFVDVMYDRTWDNKWYCHCLRLDGGQILFLIRFWSHLIPLKWTTFDVSKMLHRKTSINISLLLCIATSLHIKKSHVGVIMEAPSGNGISTYFITIYVPESTHILMSSYHKHQNLNFCFWG